jgi:hypothetical protein
VNVLARCLFPNRIRCCCLHQPTIHPSIQSKCCPVWQRWYQFRPLVYAPFPPSSCFISALLPSPSVHFDLIQSKSAMRRRKNKDYLCVPPVTTPTVSIIRVLYHLSNIVIHMCWLFDYFQSAAGSLFHHQQRVSNAPSSAEILSTCKWCSRCQYIWLNHKFLQFFMAWIFKIKRQELMIQPNSCVHWKNLFDDKHFN